MNFRIFKKKIYFTHPAVQAQLLHQSSKENKSHLLWFDNFLDVLAVLRHHLLLLFRQSLITSTKSGKTRDRRLPQHCFPRVFIWVPRCGRPLASQNTLTGTATGSKSLRKWPRTQPARPQVCSPRGTSRWPAKTRRKLCWSANHSHLFLQGRSSGARWTDFYWKVYYWLIWDWYLISKLDWDSSITMLSSHFDSESLSNVLCVCVCVCSR